MGLDSIKRMITYTSNKKDKDESICIFTISCCYLEKLLHGLFAGVSQIKTRALRF